METFSALLAICAVNSPVPGEFPAQRPVTWSFDVFFDLRLNKRLSKQSWGWWFEMLSCPLWRHCNVKSSLASSNICHHGPVYGTLYVGLSYNETWLFIGNRSGEREGTYVNDINDISFWGSDKTWKCSQIVKSIIRLISLTQMKEWVSDLLLLELYKMLLFFS